MHEANLTIEYLRDRFSLMPSDEGGELCELYRDKPIDGRADSGVIHYALAPGQRSEFHVLDCDEYWLFHAGSAVEVWVIGKDSRLRIEKLGLDADASPCLLIEKGEIFGARLCGDFGTRLCGDSGAHLHGNPSECAFMSCVTVPRFSYDGYRKLERDEMVRAHPDAKAFYE